MCLEEKNNNHNNNNNNKNDKNDKHPFGILLWSNERIYAFLRALFRIEVLHPLLCLGQMSTLVPPVLGPIWSPGFILVLIIKVLQNLMSSTNFWGYNRHKSRQHGIAWWELKLGNIFYKQYLDKDIPKYVNGVGVSKKNMMATTTWTPWTRCHESLSLQHWVEQDYCENIMHNIKHQCCGYPMLNF